MKSPQFGGNVPSLTRFSLHNQNLQKEWADMLTPTLKHTSQSAPSQSFFMGSSQAQGLWGDPCMNAENKHPAFNEQSSVFLQATVLLGSFVF